MNQNLHRISPRAPFHHYSGGIYFVTICCEDKEHFFGNIVDGVMHLTEIGKTAEMELMEIAKHFPYAQVPHHIVMPNHVHMIVAIESSDARVCVPTRRTALSVVIGAYKGAVTMYARRNSINFGWQSRYHDRKVRNQYELNRISEYITNNPMVWDQDCFNVQET